MASEPDESSRTGSQKQENHVQKLFKMSWLRTVLGVHGREILKDFCTVRE